MDFWTLLSYAAWALSGLLLLWIIFDAVRVSNEYDESLLISSREGADELIDQNGGGNGS